MFHRLLLMTGLVFGLAACDPVTGSSTGATTAQNAAKEATREARKETYRGPRGGATGR